MKRYQVHFINDKFFISDNTIRTYLNLLKKKDPSLVEKGFGKIGQHCRIAYIESSLSKTELNEFSFKFYDNPRYEFLYIKIV